MSLIFLCLTKTVVLIRSIISAFSFKGIIIFTVVYVLDL